MTEKMQNTKTGRVNGWNGKLSPVHTGLQMKEYTWPGNFPVFELRPVRRCGRLVILARHEASDTVEIFPLNAREADIKARLDDLILEMMRHDADLDEALLFDECDYDI